MGKLSDTKIIGIMGGGQLGKMTAIAATKLGQKVHVFANTKDEPACCVADNLTIADFSDVNALKAFAKSVDLITIESENIPCDAVDIVSEHTEFYPGKLPLYIAKNRLREKKFLRSLNINTTYYASIQNYEELLATSKTFCYPMRLKTVETGYDGKGQYIITSAEECASLSSLDWNTQYILESDLNLLKELSIVIARDKNGKIENFPIAENYHINGILDSSTVPAKASDALIHRIHQIAEKVAHALNIVGVLAIEFFITKDQKLLINEIAPRPHNSCHWSLDACNVSQFEQLVRAICGFSLQKVMLRFSCITKNIIGDCIYSSDQYLNNERASLTLYGKKEIRDGRKMGHVNIDLKLD